MMTQCTGIKGRTINCADTEQKAFITQQEARAQAGNLFQTQDMTKRGNRR